MSLSERQEKYHRWSMVTLWSGQYRPQRCIQSDGHLMESPIEIWMIDTREKKVLIQGGRSTLNNPSWWRNLHWPSRRNDARRMIEEIMLFHKTVTIIISWWHPIEMCVQYNLRVSKGCWQTCNYDGFVKRCPGPRSRSELWLRGEPNPSGSHFIKLTIDGIFAINGNYHGNRAQQPIKIKVFMVVTIDW